MFAVQQDTYQDLDDPIAHKQYPLVIHAGALGKDRNLVVFVHGLRGTRYGYWGNFPKFIFSDLPNTDVGMYYYETALKRLRGGQSIELDREAEVLADELRTLKHYRSITLVCHSMGGLLAKAAICSLVDRNLGFSLRKISGLILLACPQLGSLRVPSWLRWFSADARALSPHNDLIRRIDSTFSTRLVLQRTADPRDKFSIPTWAVVASKDFWVDALSAGISLPAEQKFTTRGHHSTIICPEVSTDAAYKFVLDCIDTTFKPIDNDTELRAAPASQQDLLSVRNLAVDFFGDEVTSEDDLSELISDKLVGVVRRIIITSKTERRDRLVGYWALIPLLDDVVDKIKSGELVGSALGPQHVSKTAPKTVYIGAIAAIDFNSKGLVIEALRRELANWEREGAEDLLTRPVTDDGLRLVRRYGFKAVGDGAQLNLSCICGIKISRLMQKLDH